jgi:hypothetical protein
MSSCCRILEIIKKRLFIPSSCQTIRKKRIYKEKRRKDPIVVVEHFPDLQNTGKDMMSREYAWRV